MKNKKKVFGLIPVRLESTRLPGKALKDICGLPAIVHVLKRCLMAEKLDDVYVVTDSNKIAKVIIENNGKVILTRKHINGTERIYEASKSLECTHIINIQGDEVLVNPNHINTIVSYMLESSDEYIIGVTPYDKAGHTQDFKVVIDKKNYVLYCSREDIPSSSIIHNEDRLKAVFLVGYTKNSLKRFVYWGESKNEKREPNEFLRILDNGLKIKAITLIDAKISLDTRSDLKEIRSLMKDDPFYTNRYNLNNL